MGESVIGWTNKTWIPFVGCEAVSPGCDHCYAALSASAGGRLATHPLYQGLAVNGVFTGEVRLIPERLSDPDRWRKPCMVFLNSQSDVFHDSVPDDYIFDMWAVMARNQRHTFQVLTKRHGRMRSLLNSEAFRLQVLARVMQDRHKKGQPQESLPWPLPNVWLGVSVEDQQRADLRIPALLDTAAAVRWISAEPLLGSIDLHFCGGVDALAKDWIGGAGGGSGAPHPLLDWVVVGGESGPQRRDMPMTAFHTLATQVLDAGVPLFVKQDSGFRSGNRGRIPHELWYVKQYPQPAGRL